VIYTGGFRTFPKRLTIISTDNHDFNNLIANIAKDNTIINTVNVITIKRYQETVP